LIFNFNKNKHYISEKFNLEDKEIFEVIV